MVKNVQWDRIWCLSTQDRWNILVVLWTVNIYHPKREPRNRHCLRMAIIRRVVNKARSTNAHNACFCSICLLFYFSKFIYSFWEFDLNYRSWINKWSKLGSPVSDDQLVNAQNCAQGTYVCIRLLNVKYNHHPTHARSFFWIDDRMAWPVLSALVRVCLFF